LHEHRETCGFTYQEKRIAEMGKLIKHF